MKGEASRPNDCEVGFVSPAIVSGTCDRAHITVFRGEILSKELPPAYACHGPLQKRFPEGTTVIVVVEEGIPIPPNEVRKTAQQLAKQYERGIASTAVVIFGQGFWLSAARSTITAILILTRQPFRTKLVGSVEDAVRWSAEQAKGDGLDVKSVARAVEFLRHVPAP